MKAWQRLVVGSSLCGSLVLSCGVVEAFAAAGRENRLVHTMGTPVRVEFLDWRSLSGEQLDNNDIVARAQAAYATLEGR